MSLISSLIMSTTSTVLDGIIQDMQTNEANVIKPENQEENPQVKAEEPSPESIPEPADSQEKPKKKFLGGGEPEEQKQDYKVLWEQAEDARKKAEDRINRYESKKFLVDLTDAMDAPDFDPDKFFESYKPKDFKDLSLEDLWKLKKTANANVEYTDDELAELWDEEFSSISDNKLKQKALRDSLISELKPKIDLGKEPEYVKSIRESAAQRREMEAKGHENYQKVVSEALSHLESFNDAEIVEGMNITKEDIEAAKVLIDPRYYSKADGSVDTKKLSMDRMKIALFDKLAAHVDTLAKIKAKEDVYRPNPNSVGGNAGQQNVVDEADKMIDALLGNSAVYQNVKKTN